MSGRDECCRAAGNTGKRRTSLQNASSSTRTSRTAASACSRGSGSCRSPRSRRSRSAGRPALPRLPYGQPKRSPVAQKTATELDQTRVSVRLARYSRVDGQNVEGRPRGRPAPRSDVRGGALRWRGNGVTIGLDTFEPKSLSSATGGPPIIESGDVDSLRIQTLLVSGFTHSPARSAQRPDLHRPKPSSRPLEGMSSSAPPGGLAPSKSEVSAGVSTSAFSSGSAAAAVISKRGRLLPASISLSSPSRSSSQPSRALLEPAALGVRVAHL